MTEITKDLLLDLGFEQAEGLIAFFSGTHEWSVSFGGDNSYYGNINYCNIYIIDEEKDNRGNEQYNSFKGFIYDFEKIFPLMQAMGFNEENPFAHNRYLYLGRRERIKRYIFEHTEALVFEDNSMTIYGWPDGEDKEDCVITERFITIGDKKIDIFENTYDQLKTFVLNNFF